MRRALAALVLLLLAWAVPAHAQVSTVRQTVSGTRIDGTVTINFGVNVTSSTPTDSTSIVCATVITSGGGSSFTFSDAVNGTYVIAIAQSAGTGTGDLTVAYLRGVTGGFTAVTITATGTTTDFDYACWEVAGLDVSSAIQTGTQSEPVPGGTSHTCASAGLTGTGFAVCLAQMFDIRTVTAGTGWTLVSAATNGQVIERRIAVFSSDTGSFTTNTAVASNNVMVLFREATAGGGCGYTFCDTFDRSDNTQLGTEWDSGYTGWNNLQIVGNEVRATVVATPSVESVNTFTSANQRAQTTIKTITGAQFVNVAVSLRTAAPATRTMYTCAANRNHGGGLTSHISEWTAGVEAVLASESSTTWAANDILQCDISATSISLYRIVGGTPTQLLTTTDGSIATGRVSLGLYVDTGGALANDEVDDFLATDTTAGAVGTGRMMTLGAGR